MASSTSSHMVAKDETFHKQVPSNRAEWPDFKKHFLAFAYFKDFGHLLTAASPTIPATNAAPFTTAYNAHRAMTEQLRRHGSTSVQSRKTKKDTSSNRSTTLILKTVSSTMLGLLFATPTKTKLVLRKLKFS